MNESKETYVYPMRLTNETEQFALGKTSGVSFDKYAKTDAQQTQVTKERYIYQKRGM